MVSEEFDQWLVEKVKSSQVVERGSAVQTREEFLKTGDVIFATLLLSWLVQTWKTQSIDRERHRTLERGKEGMKGKPLARGLT